MPDGHATPEPVAVLGGTGALGSALSWRLAAAGQPVILASRELVRAQETVGKLSARLPSERAALLTSATQQQAAGAAEVLLLCVPFRNHSETFTALRHVLRPGQLIVDATVPLAAAVSGKATRTIGVWQGSAAQQAQEMVPEGVSVVAGLHTISAKLLADPAHQLDQDVLLCGDRKADKRRVAELLAQIDGLRAVDAGPLEQARIVEQLTATLIGINVRYKSHAGIKITGLPSELWPAPSPTSPSPKDPA
jgi:NADPH-dependent F420 reductase